MDISLVIPAYNEERYIRTCLESALRQREHFKEIIVVDNASTDATARVAAEYEGVRVVPETRKGTGNARQTGFEESKGDLVAYVDADTHIPDGWARKIHEAFEADPKLVLLSGPYRYYESRRYPAWLLDLLWWVSPPVYWIVGYMAIGGNCAMRRDALERAGGHDRELLFYGDDTDLARRLHKQGKTRWKMNFFMYTAARHFDEDGLVGTCVQYVLNYWWPVLFGRPYTDGIHITTRV